MKFRQFSFNPFQRNKNKKKTKQSIEEQRTCKDEYLDQNSNKCEIQHFKDVDHFSQLKYPGSCDLDLAWEDEPEIKEYKQLNVEIDNQYLLHYYPYLEVVDSVNFNRCQEQVKCSCKLLTDYCNSPNIYDKHYNLFNPNELSHVSEKKTNLRTARSRIKTNPWLPTPRPIFDISPGSNSSGSSSPRSFVSDSQEVTSNLVNSVSLNVCFANEKADHESSDFNSVINNTNSLNKKSPRKQVPLNNLNCRWSIISDGDISIDLNSPIFDEIGNNFFNLENDISFEYEENVDLVLDEELGKRDIKTSVSINDLLEDSAVSLPEVFQTSDSPECSSDDNCTCSEKMDESFSDNMFPYEDYSYSSDDDADISSADDSFTDEFRSNENIDGTDKLLQSCNNLDDSIDAGYSSLKRDGRVVSESETEVSTDKTEEKCEPETVNPDQSVRESQSVQTFENLERSLPEIKSSLEEKVNILRLEKNIVQQKIREAQEEDQIRLEQRRRFNKQVSTHKKQILLDTLNDLKDKLESQSRRLQKSYSAVLTMQKQFTSRRASLSFVSATNICSHATF